MANYFKSALNFIASAEGGIGGDAAGQGTRHTNPFVGRTVTVGERKYRVMKQLAEGTRQSKKHLCTIRIYIYIHPEWILKSFYVLQPFSTSDDQCKLN